MNINENEDYEIGNVLYYIIHDATSNYIFEKRRKAILKIVKQSNSHLTQTSEGDEYKDLRNRSDETPVTWILKSHRKAAPGCNTFDIYFTS